MKLKHLPAAALAACRAAVPKQQRVTLPPPPSCNHLYANAGCKGRVKTPEYRSWLAEVSGPLLELESPPTYPCELYYVLEGDWQLGRDGGANVQKALEDACVAAGVIPDDSLRFVVGWHGAYLGGPGAARVVVWFEGATGDE